MGAGAGEGTTYWLQWQVPICALVFIVPGAVAAVVLYRLRGVHLRASDLWLPCWRRVRPGWLLGYRAVVLLVMSYVLYRIALQHGASVVYFYTQWTFSLVIVYFADREEGESQESERRAGGGFRWRIGRGKAMVAGGAWDVDVCLWLLDFLKTCYYDNGRKTSAGAVILTDIVFWGLIVPFLSNEHFKLNVLMGCMHSLNLLFLLFDTALNSLPFPWFGMAYFVLWSCTYVIFQWVLHACGFTWWPYPFLELDTPWAPLWYLCMALVHIPCYVFYTLVVKAKNSLFSKWFPNTYIRSY
ncbi:hypothetical protein Taro_043876 [Colocasia esculenta]|uniref:Uncharacterized protein n=1 Tax=Colocasia esculenta TaxID=4460 RepID=A0A843WT58_COLES|nr:hypothetical protein [Colocasia esculenta]